MKQKYLILIAILIFTVLSCKKEETTEPKPTGNLAGHIYLYNENVKTNNHSGITVSIEGVNKSTITDSLGNFSINNVDEDIYTISISKNGYAPFKQVKYKIWGNITNTINNEWPEPWLTSLPDYSVTNLLAQTSQDGGTNTILLNGQVTALIQGKNRYVRFFSGKTNSVSFDPSKYILTDKVHLDSTKFMMHIPIQQFYDAGFTPGTKIYIVAYGENDAPLGDYDDKTTGRTVYTCLSVTPSNISEITLP